MSPRILLPTHGQVERLALLMTEQEPISPLAKPSFRKRLSLLEVEKKTEPDWEDWLKFLYSSNFLEQEPSFQSLFFLYPEGKTDFFQPLPEKHSVALLFQTDSGRYRPNHFSVNFPELG